MAKLWLVMASFYFYAQGSPQFVYIFGAAVLFNYGIGFLMIRSKGRFALSQKRALLAIGLIQNITLLGYYKYSDFIITNYNTVSGESIPLLGILLPIGISFFTFQLIAYLIDCYRGQVGEYSFINYLLFITFFPQLIVGPIVHHKEIVPQFEDEQQPLFNRENVMLGLFIFSIGCAKKILLADPLTVYAQSFYSDVAGAGVIEAWVGSLGYTFSYYFDLSGYADMAIGLGLFFNILLPQNFSSPYKARNFREYWQRWHMTLSKFLSDYIFRGVYKKGDGSFKFYYAVMVTFLVSGFWHGAGWSFVLWGLLNGLFVCAAHFMTRNKLMLPFLIAWLLTFIGIVGTRVLFVSTSTSQAMDVFRKLVDFSEFSALSFSQGLELVTTFFAYNLYTMVVLLLGMAIAFFFKNSTEIAGKFKPNIKYAAFAALLFTLSLSQMTAVSDFLYFQF
jgi:alginate O-acetyltransferase complex protein AlgI